VRAVSDQLRHEEDGPEAAQSEGDVDQRGLGEHHGHRDDDQSRHEGDEAEDEHGK
jgi:hypothetical protein